MVFEGHTYECVMDIGVEGSIRSANKLNYAFTGFRAS